jgi:hypothetical protein
MMEEAVPDFDRDALKRSIQALRSGNPAHHRGTTRRNLQPELSAIDSQCRKESLATLEGALTQAGIDVPSGYMWNRLLDYEARIDKDHANVATWRTDVDRRFNDMHTQINEFKSGLGQLSEPSYRIEASDELPDRGQCEKGNVVTGVYQDKAHRMWIRCTSISRAVWNPDLPNLPNNPGVWEASSVTTGVKRQ